MAENTQILEKLDRIEAMLLSQKKVLTFEEACIYTGRSRSDLYKKTANREIPHYKPENKMVYFDVDELAAWCLRNPIKTTDQIDRQASTYVTLHKKKTAKSI